MTDLAKLAAWLGISLPDLIGWIVGGLAAIATVLLYLHSRDDPPHVRRLKGHCVRCGYDLEGMERCPECGEETDV